MAATDKHYRDQKTLNKVFAWSCVLMFLSIIWMLIDDYNKPFKEVQRTFRDVEENVNLTMALEQLPDELEVERARQELAEAREELKARQDDPELTARKQVYQAEHDRAEDRYKAIKADYDSGTSKRDIAVEHVGKARSDERASAQKAVKDWDVKLDGLREELTLAQEELDRAKSILDSEIYSQLRPFQQRVEEAADKVKQHTATFDRFAKVTAEKRWKFGDTFRNLPIIDGFAAPTRIHQIVLNDLPIDYGGFKDVTRYDRCATCHLAIDRPSFDRAALSAVATRKSPEDLLTEVQAIVDRLTAPDAKKDLRTDLRDIRRALKEEDRQKLEFAVGQFKDWVKEIKGELGARDAAELSALADQLERSCVAQSKLWFARKLFQKRKEAGENIGFDPDDLPRTVSEVKLTPGQVAQYAAHPRLDLFVDANSPHPMEKFGCTSCHGGQGSATDFTLASHTPNDALQKKRWESTDKKNDGHHWHAIHHWDFPMLPRRFSESLCLKCHHQVTDLITHGSKLEAPRLLEGHELVRENGCFGCHEIAGSKGGRSVGPDLRLEPTPPLEWLAPVEQQKARADTLNPPGTMRKVGPSLRRLSEKTSEEWLLAWLASPRGFRPDTKMPHFYNLSTNHKDFLAETAKEQKDFPAAEMYAIAEYLQTESSKYLKGEDTTRAIVRAMVERLQRKLKGGALSVREKKDLDGLTVRLRDLSLLARPSNKDAVNDLVARIQVLHDQTQEAGLAVKTAEDGVRRLTRDVADLEKEVARLKKEDEKGNAAEIAWNQSKLAKKKPELEKFKEDLKLKADFTALAGRIDEPMKALNEAARVLPPLGAGKEIYDVYGQAIPVASIPAPDAKDRDHDQGRRLFTEKGCLACHSHTGTMTEKGNLVAVSSDAEFGPELSRIAAKLGSEKTAARLWLVQWLINPTLHHPRTRMPVTQLSVAEAARIADWLLSQKVDDWKAEQAAQPRVGQLDEEAKEQLQKTLRAMAESQLAKVPAIGRLNVHDVLNKGLSEKYRTPDKLAPDADEQLLVDEGGEKAIDTPRLLRYLGKKAIGRLGCYGCHDIPGFEAAKPIGTPLNDWGKKDAERLAFEDATAFAKKHFQTVAARDDASGKRSPDWQSDGSKPLYEESYADALEHHKREGFLHLKLQEPRSYDYGRVRAWEDRLRMPQFKFARTHRRVEGDKTEELADYRARRNRESNSRLDDQTQYDEARAREAVMTFVLGLVAEPVPAKYVHTPRGDRLAEVKGRQVLDKYNCAGCHEIRPGVYEFTPPADAKKREEFFADLENTDPSDHIFTNSTAWVGRPSPFPGRMWAHGVQTDQPLFSAEPGEKGNYTVRLTEALRYTMPSGAVKNRPAGTNLVIPEDSLVARSETFGGRLARLLPEHLGKVDSTNYGDYGKRRAALPPPLLREGERVQPNWLYKFLLDPEKVRPWTVLRMPKFNMSEEEAQALTDYFSGVDRLINPGLGLTDSFVAPPQTDTRFWRSRTAEYLERLKKDKALEGEKEDLKVVWERVLKDALTRKERELAGAEWALKQAAAAEKAAEKAVKDAPADKKKEAEEALQRAKADREKEEKAHADLEKEVKALRPHADKPDFKDKSFAAYVAQWEDYQAYPAAAYRLLTDSRSICMTCHSVGDVRTAVEQGPDLMLAPQRLRPQWTEQWIANPMRFLTYPNMMPQNFPADKPVGYNFFHGTPRQHAEAARDALMDLPRLADMPVNRYRLAPKGGK